MVVVLEDDLVDSCKSGKDTAYITYVCTTSIFVCPFEMNLCQVSCQGWGLVKWDMFICHIAVSTWMLAWQLRTILENVIHSHVTCWLFDRSVSISKVLWHTESILNLASVGTPNLLGKLVHTTTQRVVPLWRFRELGNLTSYLKRAAGGKPTWHSERKLIGRRIYEEWTKNSQIGTSPQEINFWLYFLRRTL